MYDINKYVLCTGVLYCVVKSFNKARLNQQHLLNLALFPGSFQPPRIIHDTATFPFRALAPELHILNEIAP